MYIEEKDSRPGWLYRLRSRNLIFGVYIASGRFVGIRLNPDNPKYKAAIALWKRLPVPVANLVGPPLVKYLP